MIWSECLMISKGLVVVLIAMLILLLILRNANKDLRKLGTRFSLYLSVGILFVAGFVLYLPAYWHYFDGSARQLSQSILMSAYQALCLFIIDSNVDFLLEQSREFAEPLSEQYQTWVGHMILFVPVPTFGFIFSLFKDKISLLRYHLGYHKNVHVFSELNIRSLTLAQSLSETKRGDLIIFAKVDDSVDAELQEEAHALNGICFTKEISALPLKRHGRYGAKSYYIFGEDETENLVQSLALIKKNSGKKKKRKKFNTLYLLSNSAESKLLFETAEANGINLRRINETTSLVYRNLYDMGETLFKDAVPSCDGTKHISAVLIGMGGYGTEMLKALAWVGQMDGYHIKITAFDQSPQAKTRFVAACPELMSPDINHRMTKGETAYDIDIYPDVDVYSQEFKDQLRAIEQPTYVFVALGADGQNVQVATELHSYFLRLGWDKPTMQAVVYYTTQKTNLTERMNEQSEPFEVTYLGDLQTSFSAQVMLSSDLEEKALQRHLQYTDDEASFWESEYNYKSSMASAIHIKLQAACKMPGITKTKKERTTDEKEALSKLEHRRWNAYMRTEGYSYNIQRNKKAKLHPDLVPFDDLDAIEKEKDVVYLLKKVPVAKDKILLGQPLLMRIFFRICCFPVDNECLVWCYYWLCAHPPFVKACRRLCQRLRLRAIYNALAGHLTKYRFYQRSSKVQSLRYFKRWLCGSSWWVDLFACLSGEDGYNKLEDNFLNKKEASEQTQESVPL